jgi:Ni2+-binding GTPase involved in maturation of urease and hydrogenase
VGRSGETLLINAIQAQFGKPLKAYVVSRDVTTQQQLDGMIVGQAGT